MHRLNACTLSRIGSGIALTVTIFGLLSGCPDNTSPGGPSGTTDTSQAGDADAGADVAADTPTVDQTTSDAEADPGLPDVHENHPPAPTAPDINILKNVDGTSQIEHNDPDAGDSHQYEITTGPTQGTADVSDTGLVTYTPTVHYTGTDELTVMVTDSSYDWATVTIGITVTNQVPAPTADAIVTEVGSSGTTQIDPGDTDASETFAYAITTDPTYGTADVSASGLVTYDAADDYAGADSLTVSVTDGSDDSGEVVIDVTVNQTEWDFPDAFPDDLCTGDQIRVILTNLVPAPDSHLSATEDVDFLATYRYYIPTEAGDTEFGYVISGFTPDTFTQLVSPGCGSVEIGGSARVTTPDSTTASFFISSPIISWNPFHIYKYSVGDGEPTPHVTWDTVSIVPGMVIDTPTYQFDATISFNFRDEPDVDLGDDRIYLNDTHLTFNVGYAVVDPQVSQLPVRVRGVLSCDQTYVSHLLTMPLLRSMAYLVYPVAPPPIVVDGFLTRIPVTDEDTTVLITIDDCVGERSVSVTSSETWISAAPLDPVDFETNGGVVEVTIDGDLVPANSERTGYLTVGAGADELQIPVSAIGYDFNFNSGDWANLGVAVGDIDDDDGWAEIDQSFDIPFAGETYGTVSISTNGWLGLGTCVDPDLQRNPNDFFDGLFADAQQCPIISPLWSEMGFDEPITGLEPSDIYYREVTEDIDTWLEIVYWDLHNYECYANHNVIVVELHSDGQVNMRYEQIDQFGFETVGWFREDGSAGEIIPVWNIEDGMEIGFGPVGPAE